MRNQRGLPIAAYMGLLAALTLAAAFVAMLAVVLWLPPRPPDVMRADIIVDQFEAGYDHMRARGVLLRGDAMAWRVQADPPRRSDERHLHGPRAQLARRLALSADQVRLAASHIERNETFVFRVHGRHQLQTHIEMHGGEVELHAPGPPATTRTAEVRRFELRVPPPLPGSDAVAPLAPLPPTPPLFAPAPPGVLLLSGFELSAQLPDGRWLVMRRGQDWAQASWVGRAVLVIGATLASLSLLALFFARRLTRPIRNFAGAVQAVGVDPQNEPVREEGPRELRSAARAVNTMQARLRALIADRTKTLAAIAHDMRTPLMRLRLAAEHAPVEQRERMAKEIGDVEALVASFIAFARDDPAEEARVRLDLSALLQSITDDQRDAGLDVSFEGGARVIVTGQSLGLKRLFANLVDNAIKYGARARITLRREAGTILIDIADEGPGVPPEKREAVFEQFVRLHQGASGAGLGLPAARAIARAHGGDIIIVDADKGALVRVSLPG